MELCHIGRDYHRLHGNDESLKIPCVQDLFNFVVSEISEFEFKIMVSTIKMMSLSSSFPKFELKSRFGCDIIMPENGFMHTLWTRMPNVFNITRNKQMFENHELKTNIQTRHIEWSQH